MIKNSLVYPTQTNKKHKNTMSLSDPIGMDKDGNELSEVFASEKDDFIFRKGGITSEEKTITAIYEDGSEKEINIYDYAFEP